MTLAHILDDIGTHILDGIGAHILDDSGTSHLGCTGQTLYVIHTTVIIPYPHFHGFQHL